MGLQYVLAGAGHCYCLYYNGTESQVSLQGKKQQQQRADMNCTECGGPLISMLFQPSVNFDYGETPVMAFLSFLSFSHFLWLRGVGSVEVLIGNCRAHCLHIHGFLDWPASGSERHNLLQTHKPTHTKSYSHIICIPTSQPCAYTQPSQSVFCYHHANV